MKKALTILLSFILMILLIGCASRQIEVSEISVNFLLSCNVINSSITEIDFRYFDSFTPEQENFDYWNIYYLVQEVLQDHYEYETIDKSIISNNDVIKAEVSIKDFSDYNYAGEKKEVVIVIGNGEFNSEVEQELIGSSIGSKHEILLSSDGIGAYPQTSGKIISVEVLSIGKYVAGIDTEKMLRENGFSSFDDFYSYLYEIKRNEASFEYISKKKEEFFEEALKRCKFNISNDDLKNYSIQVANDYRETAKSFNMEIDDFCSDILELNEDEFFIMCTESADTEIKKCLLSGALAMYYEIEIIDSDFNEYCSSEGIKLSDSNTLSAAKYLFLETKVLEQIGIV